MEQTGFHSPIDGNCVVFTQFLLETKDNYRILESMDVLNKTKRFSSLLLYIAYDTRKDKLINNAVIKGYRCRRSYH